MAKAREASATVDIKIRMKEPLRADIERAATGKGISMNAEMVERLSRSFEHERMLDQALEWAYGRKLFALLSLLGRVAVDTGPIAAFQKTKEHSEAINWLSNAYAFDQVTKAITFALGAFRPQ